LVGIGAIALGGAAWRAWRRGAFAARWGAPYEAWRAWPHAEGPLALVHAAVLAASPHNAQPWRFRMSEGAIEIYADPERHLGDVDPFHREMHLALGCALENIVHAAAAQGLQAQIDTPPGRLVSGSTATDPAAIVHLVAGPQEKSELYRAIAKRHAHGGPYLRDHPVPLEVQHELRACVPESPALELFLFTGRERDVLADRIVDAAEALADGRSARQRRRALKTLRDVQLGTAPLLGMIAVKVPFDRPTMLAAGQCWERIQLLLTARGLVAQPLDQPAELADLEHAGGVRPLTAAALAELTGDATWHPAVVFRTGFARRPARLTPRRPLRAVLDS
jgi:hypothetical protein